jgi:hypothetical protein
MNRRYNKWGYAYANWFVVLAEGLDMFRLVLLTLAGIRTRQAICPLQKELWLAGCLGVEPRQMESLWLRASMIRGCGPCPFFSYTLTFALQLRKSTENLSQGSRLVLN